MNYWLFIIPVVSAILGWVAASTFVYYLVHNKLGNKNRVQLSEKIASQLSDWFSTEKLTDKLTPPGFFTKYQPILESHVDEFLNKKLKDEIPMLGMFITEKTTSKVKEVFMKQLEALFPKVMADMLAGLDLKPAIERLIKDKITSPEAPALLQRYLSGGGSQFKWLGAITGGLIGAVNLALFLVIS